MDDFCTNVQFIPVWLFKYQLYKRPLIQVPVCINVRFSTAQCKDIQSYNCLVLQVSAVQLSLAPMSGCTMSDCTMSDYTSVHCTSVRCTTGFMTTFRCPYACCTGVRAHLFLFDRSQHNAGSTAQDCSMSTMELLKSCAKSIICLLTWTPFY